MVWISKSTTYSPQRRLHAHAHPCWIPFQYFRVDLGLTFRATISEMRWSAIYETPHTRTLHIGSDQSHSCISDCLRQPLWSSLWNSCRLEISTKKAFCYHSCLVKGMADRKLQKVLSPVPEWQLIRHGWISFLFTYLVVVALILVMANFFSLGSS